MGKKYTVHYSFYMSDSVDIEAESEREAEEKCRQMLDGGEIGNVAEMEIGERKVWTD